MDKLGFAILFVTVTGGKYDGLPHPYLAREGQDVVERTVVNLEASFSPLFEDLSIIFFVNAPYYGLSPIPWFIDERDI